MDKNKIMILCKVVDNFGDIGVVYRLAKRLCDLRPALELTLVVSNLESFSLLAPKIDRTKNIQEFEYENKSGRVCTWKILSWNLEKEETETFLPFQTGIILECFQCGRPDWLESILFDETFTDTVQILNIDYLTAEEYADDFHLLKSGTRKTNIKKRFFMPGFTSKTGGLILDEAVKKASPLTDTFNILFFAYEKDFLPIVKGIESFAEKMHESNPNLQVCVHIAHGKSLLPFLTAYEKSKKSFSIKELTFLSQEEWDELLQKMNFNFIRGEESLSRAALFGIPFAWHAYVQDDNYQLVKVNALLEKMEPFFDQEDFQVLKDFWNTYNDEELQKNEDKKACANLALLTEKLLLLSVENRFKESFVIFSETLRANGDLVENLLKFIDEQL